MPTFDYAVDEYAFHDYVVDGYVIDDYIVDENAFNFPSLHDEKPLLPSYLNTSYPCTEHEFESVVDIVSKFETDSCSVSVSEVQSVTLGLGVLPLHEISVEPHCTNPIAGGKVDSCDIVIVE
ncbi:hypothetical protein LR48_Vigan07g118600 [Vigna angularis]|uniref:Uncharacterized protein n=1 Tax=Phaseolus angularis TaxID=3914 RepID=A0A0L9UY32_PHAAN|nr:hypothetical protein LR48_Vigan07g118600 [Vigna angularis]